MFRLIGADVDAGRDVGNGVFSDGRERKTSDREVTIRRNEEGPGPASAEAEVEVGRRA